jgi:hypothetical protein
MLAQTLSAQEKSNAMQALRNGKTMPEEVLTKLRKEGKNNAVQALRNGAKRTPPKRPEQNVLGFPTDEELRAEVAFPLPQGFPLLMWTFDSSNAGLLQAVLDTALSNMRQLLLNIKAGESLPNS